MGVSRKMKKLWVLVVSILLANCSSSPDSEFCRSALKDTHDYFFSDEFQLFDMNNMEYREQVVTKVNKFSSDLASCKVIEHHGKEHNVDIGVYAQFEMYKSDLGALEIMVDVGDNKMSDGYIGVLGKQLKQLRRININGLMSAQYKRVDR
jgi:hypothetical protein